jgi:hypothetical protein
MRGSLNSWEVLKILQSVTRLETVLRAVISSPINVARCLLGPQPIGPPQRERKFDVSPGHSIPFTVHTRYSRPALLTLEVMHLSRGYRVCREKIARGSSSCNRISILKRRQYCTFYKFHHGQSIE